MVPPFKSSSSSSSSGCYALCLAVVTLGVPVFILTHSLTVAAFCKNSAWPPSVSPGETVGVAVGDMFWPFAPEGQHGAAQPLRSPQTSICVRRSMGLYCHGSLSLIKTERMLSGGGRLVFQRACTMLHYVSPLLSPCWA